MKRRYENKSSGCDIGPKDVSSLPLHSEANLSQTAKKREKKNIIIFLVPIRNMVKRDAVTKLHGIISMYINVIVIQS